VVLCQDSLVQTASDPHSGTDAFAMAHFRQKSVTGTMNSGSSEAAVLLVIALALLAGCGTSPVPSPLDDRNINLIFVVSEDLAFHAP